MPRLGRLAPAFAVAVALLSGGCSDPDKANPAPASAQPPTGATERVTASHILIGFKNPRGGRVTRTEAQAKELATSVMADLAAGRRKFEDLAQAFSDDRGEEDKLNTNNAIPGSYTFGRKQMVKPFEDAAFSTPIGQIAPEPVKSEYGYHIIRRDK